MYLWKAERNGNGNAYDAYAKLGGQEVSHTHFALCEEMTESTSSRTNSCEPEWPKVDRVIGWRHQSNDYTTERLLSFFF